MIKTDIKSTKKKVTELLRTVDREGIESLLSWLETSNFFTSPASTMFHGNYEGGLAAHSYEVYAEFSRQVEHYCLKVPQESRILSGILHDCCKIDFYKENRLKKGNVSESKPYKTNDLFPVGHGEKSVILAQRYIPLTDREAVLIRWHMGAEDPAWQEYKEKVEKAFPEVILFQNADKEVSRIRKI